MFFLWPCVIFEGHFRGSEHFAACFSTNTPYGIYHPTSELKRIKSNWLIIAKNTQIVRYVQNKQRERAKTDIKTQSESRQTCMCRDSKLIQDRDMKKTCRQASQDTILESLSLECTNFNNSLLSLEVKSEFASSRTITFSLIFEYSNNYSSQLNW